jgi:hypothetical protein
MPYGSSFPVRDEGIVQQRWNGALVAQNSTVGNYPKHGSVTYSRSGDNATTVRSPPAELLQDRVRMEWEWVAVPKGKRLAFKIWSKRLNKFVWARRHIAVKRLVKKFPPKKPKPKKGFDLPPNRLSYVGSTVAYFGDSQNVTVSNGSDTLTLSGPLWASFQPFGSNTTLEGTPASFLGRNVSDYFDSYVAEADANCIPRLYEKVKSQSVNLAQALVEYRQTAKLFKEVVIRLVKFWLQLKSGNLTKAIGGLFPGSGKQLANDHLAIQYGVRPLLGDLEGIAKILTGARDVVFDIKVRKRINIPRTRIHYSDRPYGITWAKCEVHSSGYVEVKYKYRFKLSSPGMALQRTLTELGFGNLNSLAWESIPFSFVVDWFLPIGSYLNNADAFDNLVVVHATKTVFRKETIEFRRTFGGSDSGYTTSQGQSGFVNDRVTVDRSLTGVPSLAFPDFKDPVSKLHIANAIALLTQLRK